MEITDYHKQLLHTSPDERYNLYQLWTSHEPHRLEDRVYGDLILVDNSCSEMVWRIEEPARVITRECKDPVIGWHGDYIVLLMYPTDWPEYFNIKHCYAALIDVKKGEIIQREPVYYSMFRLNYFDADEPHLRVYSETYPEDRLQHPITLMENHGCRVEAEPKKTTVYFEQVHVVVPDLQLIHIPEAEMWSPNRRMCCFYAYYHRDVLAIFRLRDDDSVTLETWNLAHRPSMVLWDNTFVPVVCGIEARKSPFTWDDSEYFQLRAYRHIAKPQTATQPKPQADTKPAVKPAVKQSAPGYQAPAQPSMDSSTTIAIKVGIWLSIFLLFGFLAGLIWLLVW